MFSQLKKWTVYLTLACLAFSAFASLAAAESYVQVTATNVNVRSGPGLTHEVIGRVSSPMQLSVVSVQNDWVQVKLADGKVGWIAGWLVQEVTSATNPPAPVNETPPAAPTAPASPPTPTAPATPEAATIQSKVTNLNVRTGPDTTYSVITMIQPGQSYPVVEKKNDWIHIKLSDTETGWVAGWLVQEQTLQAGPVNDKGQVNLTALTNVHQAPDHTSPIIGQLSPGDTIQIGETVNGWYKIVYDGFDAWIHVTDQETEPTHPVQPEPPSTEQPLPQVTVHANQINLHSQPAEGSTLLSSLAKGTILTVLEAKDNWYYVQTPYGQSGWVANWLVSELTGVTPIAKQPMATVLNNKTNVRSGPGTQYEVIGQVQAGEHYPVVKTEGDWHQLKLRDGTLGFVAGWLLSIDQGKVTKNGNELSGKVIVVDPGHGGDDPGATGPHFATLEKNINLQVSQLLKNKLEAAGAKVIMTRNDDRKLTLQQRVDIAVQNKADLFISVHHNTHPNPQTNGTIVFYYHEGNSSKLASLVQSEIVKATNYNNMNARFGNYYVLRENPVVSILAEIAFLSNYNDESLARSTKHQELAAEGIYAGVVRYFQSQ